MLYSVLRDTGSWSVLYFMAWVFIGRFTFLTLFLAVTLDAFETHYDEEENNSSMENSNYSSSYGS